MITIDPHSREPVFEQLLKQLRFQIASARFAVGEGARSSASARASVFAQGHVEVRTQEVDACDEGQR